MIRDITFLCLTGAVLLSVLFNLYQVGINRLTGRRLRRLEMAVAAVMIVHQIETMQNPPVDLTHDPKEET